MRLAPRGAVGSISSSHVYPLILSSATLSQALINVLSLSPGLVSWHFSCTSQAHRGHLTQAKGPGLCWAGPATVQKWSNNARAVLRRRCSSRMAHPVSLILQQSWNFWFSRRIGLTPSVCWQEALPSGRVETKCGEKKPEVNLLAEGITKGKLWWVALRFVWSSASGAGSLQDGWDRNKPLGGKSHLPSWIPTSTFYLLAMFQSTKHCRQ